MINKNTLTSVISKYYLNGLNNQVKWRIKDNQLVIYAGEAGRVCKVVHSNFQLEDMYSQAIFIRSSCNSCAIY